MKSVGALIQFLIRWPASSLLKIFQSSVYRIVLLWALLLDTCRVSEICFPGQDTISVNINSVNTEWKDPSVDFAGWSLLDERNWIQCSTLSFRCQWTKTSWWSTFSEVRKEVQFLIRELRSTCSMAKNIFKKEKKVDVSELTPMSVSSTLMQKVMVVCCSNVLAHIHEFIGTLIQTAWYFKANYYLPSNCSQYFSPHLLI